MGVGRRRDLGPVFDPHAIYLFSSSFPSKRTEGVCGPKSSTVNLFLSFVFYPSLQLNDLWECWREEDKEKKMTVDRKESGSAFGGLWSKSIVDASHAIVKERKRPIA